MKQQADNVRRSIQEAQIVRPIPESDEMSAPYAGDYAAIRHRQQQKQAAYTSTRESGDRPPQDDYGYFGDSAHERPLTYDDDDPHARPMALPLFVMDASPHRMMQIRPPLPSLRMRSSASRSFF